MKMIHLALFVVCAGCQVAETPTPSAASVPNPTPSTSVPAPTPVAQDEQKTQAPPDPAKRQENAQRIHQLDALETAELEVNGKKLKVWLMDTASKQAEGMMFLTEKEVKADEAMLFVYNRQDLMSFWMRNTLIPLDIAFIDRNGVTVRTARMKPLDETSVSSVRPAQYALEMKAGAFKRWNIKEGTRFKIPSTVKAKDE